MTQEPRSQGLCLVYGRWVTFEEKQKILAERAARRAECREQHKERRERQKLLDSVRMPWPDGHFEMSREQVFRKGNK